ncbi:MAG: GtrA family protein [Hyphomonas sp.]
MQQQVRQLGNSHGARYFVASLAALAVDYVFTLFLFHAARLDLSTAAAISFFSVGAIFYLVHEYWTFRHETSRFSGRRMAGTVAVLCLAGVLRVAVIFALETLRAPEGLWVTAYFCLGVAVSFTTNFLASKYLVFRR